MPGGRLRVGVIGIGFGQGVHVPAFRSDDSCEVAVIAASAVERAARVARRLGIVHAVGSWRDVATDPGIDVVSIAVPPRLQPEIVIAAVAAGKHVLCEKPVALSAAEASRMLDAAERADVVHAVDFEFPELAAWRRAHALCAEGRLGELRRVHVDWRVLTRAAATSSDSWKTRDADGGGVFGGFLSHTLYHLEWLGGRVRRLRARHDRGHGEDAPAVEVWAELASGATATVAIATDVTGGSGHRVGIVGTTGTLRIDNPGPDHAGPFALTLNGEPTPVDADGAASGDRRVHAVARLVSRFLAAVRGGSAMRPSLVDGLRVQELLDTARASARDDTWATV